jgi:hypothetical protein
MTTTMAHKTRVSSSGGGSAGILAESNLVSRLACEVWQPGGTAAANLHSDASSLLLRKINIG